MSRSSPTRSLAISVLFTLLLVACVAPPAQRSGLPGNVPVDEYPRELLDLAMAKGGLDWQRNDGPTPHHPELADVQIRWGDQPVAGFEPVDVAIRRGLNDYWVALIRPAEQSRFDAVRSWRDMLCFTAAASTLDPVGSALQRHGLSVRILPEDADPGDWLASGKVDFVVVPAADVAALLHDANGRYALERRLAFNHHQPYRFMVRDGETKLADYVRLGLVIADRDGSFEALFDRYHERLLDLLALSSRHILPLPYHGNSGERFVKSSCAAR